MRASSIVVTRDIHRFGIAAGETGIVRRLIGEQGRLQAVRQRDGRPFVAPTGSWRFAQGSTAILPGGVHGQVHEVFDEPSLDEGFDDPSLVYSVAAGETFERQDVAHDDLAPIAHEGPQVGDVVHFLADAHYVSSNGRRIPCRGADTLPQSSGFVVRRHPFDGDYLVAVDSPDGAARTWVWADSQSLLVVDRPVEGEQDTLAPGTEVIVGADPFWIDTNDDKHPSIMPTMPRPRATVEAASHITGNVVISDAGTTRIVHRSCLEVTTVATSPQPIDPQGTDTMTTIPENAITERTLPILESDTAWTQDARIDPYWLYRLYRFSDGEEPNDSRRWVTPSGAVTDQASLCCLAGAEEAEPGERAPIGRITDQGHSPVLAPLNPEPQVGQVILVLSLPIGGEFRVVPFLAKVEDRLGINTVFARPVGDHPIAGAHGAIYSPGTPVTVSQWLRMDDHVQRAYGGDSTVTTQTPAEETDARADSTERLREMVVNFYNEGLRHGYLDALEGFEEWFEETAGVNAARFAGTPYHVRGEYEVRGVFNGHPRWLVVPYGQETHDLVWTLAAVENTRIVSSTALHRIAKEDHDRAPLTDGPAAVTVDLGRFTFTPASGARADLPDHADPEDLMDAVLSWVGERAQEDSWCSEYEAFCRKNGYEPRRGGSAEREREVTARIEVEYETDYSVSSTDQDRELLDAFVGSDHSPSLGHFSLSMTYTVDAEMQVMLPSDLDVGDVTIEMEEVETWLESEGLPFTRVLEVEVIDIS